MKVAQVQLWRGVCGQVTSQLAYIVVTEPLTMTVEALTRRTDVIVEIVADQRMVTSDTAVSTCQITSLHLGTPG